MIGDVSFATVEKVLNELMTNAQTGLGTSIRATFQVNDLMVEVDNGQIQMYDRATPTHLIPVMRASDTTRVINQSDVLSQAARRVPPAPAPGPARVPARALAPAQLLARIQAQAPVAAVAPGPAVAPAPVAAVAPAPAGAGAGGKGQAEVARLREKVGPYGNDAVQITTCKYEAEDNWTVSFERKGDGYTTASILRRPETPTCPPYMVRNYNSRGAGYYHNEADALECLRVFLVPPFTGEAPSAKGKKRAASDGGFGALDVLAAVASRARVAPAAPAAPTAPAPAAGEVVIDLTEAD